MFNLKYIVAGLIVTALVLGGVVEVKLHPNEIVNVPSRLLALAGGENILAQGQEYVQNLIASFKSDKSDKNEEEDKSEVAGAKDNQEEGKEDNEDQKDKDTPSLNIPLRF